MISLEPKASSELSQRPHFGSAIEMICDSILVSRTTKMKVRMRMKESGPNRHH